MRQRYRLECENLAIRDMVRGTLIRHYKKCGSKVCICREGKLHGPYWYLTYTERGRSGFKYVKVKDLAIIIRLARNYKRFQSNITGITRMNREIVKLMGEMREILVLRRKK